MVKKIIFLGLLVVASLCKSVAQGVHYQNLLYELQEKIAAHNFEHIIKMPDDKHLTDSLLALSFRNTCRAFLNEIAYGHVPKNIQYVGLKENLNQSKIEEAVLKIEQGVPMQQLIAQLEPQNLDFNRLKNSPLLDSLPGLAENLNLHRYINRFDQRKYIIANIPAAMLYYYEGAARKLSMKIIVGNPQNPSPILDSYIHSITVYPYWVPTRNIATKELLPLIQKNIKYLEINGFDVLDMNGKLVDPKKVPWKELSAKKFPYKLRQSTGCDNSLGLLKFNLENPFSIYLHDTKHTASSQNLFNKSHRFFSHGCIRLSQPLELANMITDKPMLNDDFMDICAKEQKSTVLSLSHKIPVFIVYHTQSIDEKGALQQWPNPYKLK